MGKNKKSNNYGLEYEVYLKECELLIKTANDQISSYDKYLLTISSGTFGLTVTT